MGNDLNRLEAENKRLREAGDLLASEVDYLINKSSYDDGVSISALEDALANWREVCGDK